MIHISRSAALLAVVLASPLGTVPAAAQMPYTPRALSLGGAIGASARGYESVLYNPALLSLSDGPGWSVALAQFSAGTSVVGPRASDLPDFLDYSSLTEERQQELMAMIPDGGTAVDLDLRAPVAALQVGRMGFALSYVTLGEHTLGRDLVELFFDGYDQTRTDYVVGNTGGTRASMWDLAAAYGRSVGPVSLGATAHYYRGRTVVRTAAFEPDYDLVNQRVSVEYVGVSSEGGSGYGLDVGAALQPLPGLTVSAAVANLVSSLDWNTELTGRSLVLSNEDFADAEYMLLKERYEASEQELGASPSGRHAVVAEGLGLDQWTLPATLHLGAAWKTGLGTEVSAAYQSQLEDGRFGGRWERLAGIGIQQRIPFVTLRLGASSDLADGTMVGGGVRLGVIDVGAAHFTTAARADGAPARDGWAASFSVNTRTLSPLR